MIDDEKGGEEAPAEEGEASEEAAAE